MAKWLVIDVPNLAWRAHYTTGKLSHDGRPTGVLFGFLRDLVGFREKFPDYGPVFCFDEGEPLRRGVFPGYKAKRVAKRDGFGPVHDQLLKLRDDVLPEIGYRNILSADGYEADDLIASVVGPVDENDDDFIVASSDHDLYQLLRAWVSIYDPGTKRLFHYNDFVAKYRVRPNRWAEVKCLAGCTSDEIAGIAGVGEKTAIRYILGELGKSKVRTRLDADSGVTVEKNMPLVRLPYRGTPEFRPSKDRFNLSRFRDVLRSLGMDNLARRLLDGEWGQD